MLPSWSEALLGERASLAERVARAAHLRRPLPSDWYFPDPSRRRKLARARRAAAVRSPLTDLSFLEDAIRRVHGVTAARVVVADGLEAVHVVTEDDRARVEADVMAVVRAVRGEARAETVNVVGLRAPSAR